MHFTVSHKTTSVKIIVAPVGIPAKNEIVYPAAVPINPDITDHKIIREYTFVKIIAIFGGIVRSESTSTIPAILIFKTIVRATRAVVTYLNIFT
jgi:hypothetical protein